MGADFLYPLATLSFEYPVWLLAPFLFFIFSYLKKDAPSSFKYPSFSELRAIKPSLRTRLRSPTLAITASLFVIFLSLAAARPYKSLPAPETAQDKNIILLVDISGSMLLRDFRTDRGAVSRISGVKQVTETFVERVAERSRVGIILFGGQPYIAAPLTRDIGFLQNTLQNLEVDQRGDATAIGDAIAAALKGLEDQTGSSAIVLLTDGKNNSGRIDPLAASRISRALGIQIYPIGIGQRDRATVRERNGVFESVTESDFFDEELLIEIARITGGIYRHAGNFDLLESVFRDVKNLEIDVATRQKKELFHLYLLVALFAFMAFYLFEWSIFLKIE